MRCPNPSCREVFTVQAEESTAAEGSNPAAPATLESAPEAGEQPRTGSGGIADFVPVLPAFPEGGSPRPPAVGGETWYAAAHVEDMVPLLPAEADLTPVTDAPAPPPPPPPVVADREEPPRGELYSAVDDPTPYSVVRNWNDEPPPPRARPPAPEAPARSESTPAPAAVQPAPPPPRSGKKTVRQTAVETKLDEPRPQPAPGPVEMAPGEWAPPPVRRRDGKAGADVDRPAAVTEEPHVPPPVDAEPPVSLETSEPELAEPPPRKRKVWTYVAILGGLMVAAAAGFAAFIALHKPEEAAAAAADKTYAEHHYTDAANAYSQLLKDFQESAAENKKRYDFMQKLSVIRGKTESFVTDPERWLQALDKLVDENAGGDFLADTKIAADIGNSYHNLAAALVNLADENADPRLLALAEKAVQKANHFAPEEPTDAVTAQIAAIREKVAKQNRFAQVLALLQDLVTKGQVDALTRGQRVVREAARHDPDFAEDPRLLKLLGDLRALQLTRVTWVPGMRLNTLMEPTDPTVVVAPALVSAPAAPENDRVIFALARGLLYAFSQNSGTPLWATRVGIDTTMLPVRLPPSPYVPESVLVLSTLGPDENYLTRRNARTGEPLWHYHLTAPALGQPVVLDGGHEAYVPTYDGKIHEIDVLEGRLVGWFDVHQPITVGPVHQEGTNLLYVAADSRNVFVLDLKNHEKPCQAILDSGHPAGSLRSAPIIVSRHTIRENRHEPVERLPDYLVLNQADGLTSMTLKIFGLPIATGEARPLLERKFHGWPWFPPTYDGEKIVQVTDAGTLEVVGINQVNDQDEPLFVIQADPLPIIGAATGRAQVVYTIEDDYWVLAHGELQRYHFDKFGLPGHPAQHLQELWSKPVRLGSPMHASQVDETTKTLILVTQSVSLQNFLISAVDMDDGHIRWQRQLGFISQGDALALGSDVVAVDQGGGLFAFDSQRPLVRLRHHYLAAPNTMLFASNEQTVRATLLHESPGTGVYEFATAPGSGEMIVRRYEPGQETFKDKFDLPSAPAGAPALGERCVYVLLANGDLLRQPLGQDVIRSTAIHWRAQHAEEGAEGFVVALPGDDLLTTDGSRGLVRSNWQRSKDTFVELAKTEVPGSATLPARIIAAPLLVKPPAANGEISVAVACADGSLTILKDTPSNIVPHGWELVKKIELGGKITVGPFLCRSFIGCVVDGRTLVFIDPAGKNSWKYQAPEGIVGQPGIVGDFVVVADQSGRYICLDPLSGKEQPRSGHTIRTGAGPAGMPVAYGKNHVLAPLTDGTMLLLPLASFTEPL